jgi:hypothetical protein
MIKLKSITIEDRYDVVKFNHNKKRIKSEFLHFESKSDRIEFQILNMSQYFGHNFQLKYRIEVIPAVLER